MFRANVEAVIQDTSAPPDDGTCAGVFMKLVAAASIRPGEEILWHYQLCPSQHAKPTRVAVKYFYDLAKENAGTGPPAGDLQKQNAGTHPRPKP